MIMTKKSSQFITCIRRLFIRRPGRYGRYDLQRNFTIFGGRWPWQSLQVIGNNRNQAPGSLQIDSKTKKENPGFQQNLLIGGGPEQLPKEQFAILAVPSR